MSTKQELIDANARLNAKLDEITRNENYATRVVLATLTDEDQARASQSLALRAVKDMAKQARESARVAFYDSVRRTYGKDFGVSV